MEFNEVMKALEEYGNPQTKKTLAKHGAKEPFFGVKVQDLKKILKQTKKNHSLSLALYDTGNTDAMYLAGLMADETKMTKSILQDWASKAYWYYLSEYTVPWVAAETAFGFELAKEWIQSDEEQIAAAGWSTLGSIASLYPDDSLDVAYYRARLKEIRDNIHQSPNRVRYVKNGFVIAVASYINSLTEEALAVAKTIGKVSVDMNGTACKVPLADEYILKLIDKNRIGKKRKSARC